MHSKERIRIYDTVISQKLTQTYNYTRVLYKVNVQTANMHDYFLVIFFIVTIHGRI